MIGSESELDLGVDEGRGGNENGSVGKSSIDDMIFRAGTVSVMGSLPSSVKSAAGLPLIRAGSSFVLITLESSVPRIDQLDGKKSGTTITRFSSSKLMGGLRPRGVGGHVRDPWMYGVGEMNDSSMVAGRFA